MEAIRPTLSPQFQRRASTAQFIVRLETYFTEHVLVAPSKPLFSRLPTLPGHLRREVVEECRSIASMLSIARTNKYEVTWDAEAYARDLKNVVLPNLDVEDRLVAKYPPILGVEGLQQFQNRHLPIVPEPAVFSDIKGHEMLWSLPGILSPERQRNILSATRALEAQLTKKPHDEDEPETKGWRTDDTFFNPGVEWTSGSTLLYPAGFQQGHTGPQFLPAPSTSAKSARAHDWMVAFEESGGILDGILAVTHPDLYRSAQELMSKLSTDHAPSNHLMQAWPSCFTAVQVISNRLAPWHRDLSSMPGWYDLLLTLGSYDETAVLELPSLGVAVPYDSGSGVLITSRLLLHGVPRVPGDRICYAFYMRRAVFEWFEMPLAGMASAVPVASQATTAGPEPRKGEDSADDMGHGSEHDGGDTDGGVEEDYGNNGGQAAPSDEGTMESELSSEGNSSVEEQSDAEMAEQ